MATTAPRDAAAGLNAAARERALEVQEPSGPRRRLIWHYPRFRWWEYAAAGVVSAGNISLELLYRGHHPPDRWTKPILLDSAVRNLLRAESKEGVRTVNHAADYLWYGVTGYVLLDGLATPLVTDRFNTDVALQLTLLNWQAIGTAGLLARLAHDTVGRTRPLTQGCSNDPHAENHCEFKGASFVAGHAMMTTANAALACANHHALPMYGGGIADAAVCPVMVSAALAVGVLRMAGDNHWFSDTVVGWAMGGTIGYGLPWLLHYRYVKRVVSPLPNTALIPWGNETSAGVQFVGAL